MRGYHLITRCCVFTLMTVFAGIDHTDATAQSCVTSSQSWIEQLSSSENDILFDHCLTRCNTSKQWMLEHQRKTSESGWRQMCTDLVLLWGHKECVYFRDYIEPSAYTPCKNWTVEMFNKCMENDTAWFSTPNSG